jgi:hypothetical protein
MESPARRMVVGCLIGLALALLLVGLVSGTVLRHIVQIVPIMVVLAVVRRRPDWGAYAAIPIFLFWTFIVTMIWLFLLGLSRIANGHYTSIEVISTFFMMAFSIAGGVKCVQLGRSLPAAGRTLAFFLFAGMQVAAMWVSFLRPIANR